MAGRHVIKLGVRTLIFVTLPYLRLRVKRQLEATEVETEPKHIRAQRNKENED